METLEFVIYPDGRVQEKVTGISGRSCQEVTAAIEAQLGIVLSTEPTSELYETVQQDAATVDQAENRMTWDSQWS